MGTICFCFFFNQKQLPTKRRGKRKQGKQTIPSCSWSSIIIYRNNKEKWNHEFSLQLWKFCFYFIQLADLNNVPSIRLGNIYFYAWGKQYLLIYETNIWCGDTLKHLQLNNIQGDGLVFTWSCLAIRCLSIGDI